VNEKQGPTRELNREAFERLRMGEFSDLVNHGFSIAHLHNYANPLNITKFNLQNPLDFAFRESTALGFERTNARANAIYVALFMFELITKS
jgi:hypothetical protein